jgi:Tfp pilus assembly protein PilX
LKNEEFDMRMRTSEQGSALILAVVVTLVVAGMSGTYLTLSVSKKNATFTEVEREKAFYAAEAALAQAKYELSSGRDYDTPGLGNVTLNGLANTQCSVTVDTTGLTGNQKRLTAICTFGPTVLKVTDRSIEEVVDKPISTVTALGMAAVVSRDPMDFKGNINVDGRDWNMAGTSVVAAGVNGVVSGGAVTVTGSAGIGGNGIAPPGSGSAPGSVDANHDWATDGLDNDREGTVDQPGETYPSDPDQALGLPAGTLKANAQASGTYFSTQAAYAAAIAANGGQMPGGKIMYCDFIPSPPFELGTGLNATPSILVVHNSTSTAVAKNVHGDFKGLLLADKIELINAGTKIVGMVQAWGQFGNLSGAGNSDILFSSAVLANLPTVIKNFIFQRKSYREVVR